MSPGWGAGWGGGTVGRATAHLLSQEITGSCLFARPHF